MQLNIDPDWFTMMVEAEDNCIVSVGGFFYGPEPEPVFQPGDIVIPQVRIPYVRPAFCDQECRVTEVRDEKVCATPTKWDKVPAWGFKARELVLVS